MTVRNFEIVSDMFKRLGISTGRVVKIMHTNGTVNLMHVQLLLIPFIQAHVTAFEAKQGLLVFPRENASSVRRRFCFAE
jgi:hypothetical protein